MIDNIRETDKPWVVIADGPKFNFDLVIDTGTAMLKSLVSAAKSAFPGASVKVRGMGDEDEWSYFNRDTILLMKMALYEEYGVVDVSPYKFMVKVGALQIDFCPFGSEFLQKAGEVYLCSDGSIHEFDCVPSLVASRSLAADTGKAPTMFMDGYEQSVVRGAWDTFIEKGIKFTEVGYPSGPCMITALFDHDSFGNGEGDIRITCIED